MKRLLLVSLLALASLGLPACGPSSAQIRAARTATYQGDEAAIFRAALAAVRDGYDVQASDPATGTLVTAERWYEANGTFAGSRWDHASRRRIDRSILLHYRVTLHREAGQVRVEVVPVAQQLRAGYSALFPMAPGDPSMPGWISGKTDLLSVAIWERLRPFEVAPR